MKLLSRKSITATAAIAILGGLSIAAAPTQAASPVHRGAAVHTSTAAHADLTPGDLAKLPLTNRHLTKHERANLAVVLRDYHVAEGNSLDVDTFVNSFADDGVFNDMVPGQAYRGKALGDVLPYMANLFPDVHRELKRITVNGDVISIELSIQGTFEDRCSHRRARSSRTARRSTYRLPTSGTCTTARSRSSTASSGTRPCTPRWA